MAIIQTKAEHEIRRPGAKSSEFILTLLATFFVAVFPMLSEHAARALQSSPYAPIALAILAAAYNISRGLVKKSRNDASALATKAPENVNAGGDVNMGQTPGQMVGNLALGYAERRLNKRGFADVDDELAELEIPVDSQ